MTSVFRIGLLMVFVAVVTAEYEYSSKVVNALPDWKALNKQGVESLDYELAYPEATVELHTKSTEAHQVSFYSKEELLPTIKKKNSFGRKLSLSRSNSPNSRKVHDQPGIFVRRTPGESPARIFVCVLPKECYEKYLRFTEMNVRLIRDGNQELCMQLVLNFEDSEQNEKLDVIMYFFKQPVQQVEIQHSIKNRVPRVDYPIFRKEASKYRSEEELGDPVLFNVVWLGKALRRAKLLTRHKDSIEKRTYLAGPVIVESEEFNSFLRLLLKTGI